MGISLKNCYRVAIVFLSISLTAGCLHQSQHSVSSNLVSYLYPDGNQINHAADQIPHLNLPLRVGIAFIPEENADVSFSLSATEKLQLLETVAKNFKGRDYIQSIEIIPEIYLRQGKGFTTISQVAALHGLDVMALVSYDHLSIKEENALSFAYLTVIGAFIVHGESTQSQTFVDTAIFDVATKKLLFRAPGAASLQIGHSMVGSVEKARELRNQTFAEAVEKMNANLDVKLSEFRQRVQQEEIATVSYRKGYSGGGSTTWIGISFLLLLIRFTRKSRS